MTRERERSVTKTGPGAVLHLPSQGRTAVLPPTTEGDVCAQSVVKLGDDALCAQTAQMRHR